MATNINHCLRHGFCFFLALTFSLPVIAGGGHDHGASHDAPHDDHGAHEEEAVLVYTDYSDTAELFLEFPPLVAKEPSPFVAHFTRLDNFQPFASGVLNIRLKQDGKTKARFRVKQPARTGVYLPAVTPRDPGDYQLVLDLKDGELHSVHDLGMVTVFPGKEQAVVEQQAADGEITYLKEQQWANPHAITRTLIRPLRPSVPGFGTVMAPADGFAIVRAPSNGYYTTQQTIYAGQSVTADQSLGTVVPRLGGETDIGNLLVERERARSRYELATADVARLDSLFKQGAIPEKRLQEAQQGLEVAKVELQTAESRLEQQSGQQGAAGIALRAPIAGDIVDSSVTSGAFVNAGDPLFTIASQEKRWLKIRVPEKYGSNLRHISGAWLADSGSTTVLDASNGTRVVKVSQQVDPVSRTVAVAIEYPAVSGPALIGARLPAHVYVDAAKPYLSIPVSAVIDDGGQPVVYVQRGGETFSRRSVTLGIRDGHWVEVTAGLQADEWVVSSGAYYVKLAATGGDAIGHGHAH